MRGMIFDLDGTLVDTNGAHVEAWYRSFKTLGHSVSRERIFSEIGKGSDKLPPALLGKDADRKMIAALRRCVGEIYPELAKRRRFRVMPGAVDLLEELRRRGIRTALATSGRDDLVDATLDSARVDFRSLVDVTVTGSDAKATKPDPDIVVTALRRLRVEPGACAMVGDTPYDGEACRAAGVRFLGVTCGGRTAAELSAASAWDTWPEPAALLLDVQRVLGAS
jgi:HAD superfamily hydrolase (TIGR01509 family)